MLRMFRNRRVKGIIPSLKSSKMTIMREGESANFSEGGRMLEAIPDKRRELLAVGGRGEKLTERVKRGCRSRVDKPRGTRAPLAHGCNMADGESHSIFRTVASRMPTGRESVSNDRFAARVSLSAPSCPRPKLLVAENLAYVFAHERYSAKIGDGEEPFPLGR